MTIDEIQFKDIFKRLRAYKMERNLTSDMQKEGLLGNLLEELTEYTRANTEEEKIDALCDIVVFTANVMNDTEKDTDLELAKFPILVLDENRKLPKPLKLVKLAVETLKENKEAFYMNLIENCMKDMYSLGYDPYKCMIETIKEIFSRKGCWDDKIKKFVKYQGFYTKEDIIKKYLEEDKNLKEEDIQINDYDFETWGVNVDAYPHIHKYPKWYKAEYKNCKLTK